MRLRAMTITLTATAVLGLAACGGDDDESSDTGSPTPAATQTATTTERDPQRDAAPLGKKPQVEKTSGPPPAALVKEDIVKGDGAVAMAGKTVTVHYVGVLYDTGEQFDASWDKGDPFIFELGAGAVIQGWEQGVDGMRVGGRRKLVIPPELGYGPQETPGIPANSTLIFVVDLLKVD